MFKLGSFVRRVQSSCVGRTTFVVPKIHKGVKAQTVRPFAILSSMSDGSPSRVNIYTDFTIYKGKGAMTLKVIKPTWERVPTGSGLKIAREGTILLEFANARGERDYDWDSKSNFALNAVECAEILDAAESSIEKSFFHDPNKMGAGEGTVTKSLRISPARDSGYFFSLTVNNKAGSSNNRYDTVVSPAEMRVIRQIMEFSIIRLLGLDEVFAGPPDIRESNLAAPIL